MIRPVNKINTPFETEFRAKSNDAKYVSATLTDDEKTAINRFLPKFLQFGVCNYLVIRSLL